MFRPIARVTTAWAAGGIPVASRCSADAAYSCCAETGPVRQRIPIAAMLYTSAGGANPAPVAASGAMVVPWRFTRAPMVARPIPASIGRPSLAKTISSGVMAPCTIPWWWISASASATGAHAVTISPGARVRRLTRTSVRLPPSAAARTSTGPVGVSTTSWNGITCGWFSAPMTSVAELKPSRSVWASPRTCRSVTGCPVAFSVPSHIGESADPNRRTTVYPGTCNDPSIASMFPNLGARRRPRSTFHRNSLT